MMYSVETIIDEVWDEEGKEYIDYIGSWGPMILGHSHPEVLERVLDACRRGLSFGAATAAEVEMARPVQLANLYKRKTALYDTPV